MKRYRSDLLAVLVLAILTQVMGHLGFFRAFEMGSLDAFLNLQKPVPTEHVFLVVIDNDDYRDLFGERSPLDPTMLARILEAMLAYQPRVVGVDIDTSHRLFAPLATNTLFSSVVWAQAIRDLTEQAPGTFLQILGDLLLHETHPVNLAPLLGQDKPLVRRGIGLFPLDGDGVFRRHLRLIPAGEEGGAPVKKRSLAMSLMEAYDGERARDLLAREEEAIINFPASQYQLHRIRASHLLQQWQAPGADPFLEQFRDRIWLLGGTYAAARDLHPTAAGLMSGVDILATTIEAEIAGRVISGTSGWLHLAVDVATGLLMVLLGRTTQPRLYLLLSLLLVPALALAASYLLFTSLAFWLSFVPMVAGIFIHQLWHDLESSGRPRAEHARGA